MIRKVWLLVGMKYGDILSCLPVIQDAFRASGKPQSVIVSKQYADILEGVPGLMVQPFSGNWQDLRAAYALAKRSFREVICPATFGEGFSIQKRLPSFQLDQWDRMGRVQDWDTLPLTMKRPEAPPLPMNGHRYILFADRSESSPFADTAETMALLASSAPEHEVLRLGEHRFPRLSDALALYDRADLLVCTETAHLHLSKASDVPVIALTADSPTRWHGSAWSKRFRLQVRYSDFGMRKQEIAIAVRKAVNNTRVPALEMMPIAPKGAYNPSILQVGDKVWTTWRLHPEKTSWRTVLELHDGTEALPVVVPGYEDHSLEDGRLFMWRGAPHISLNIARSGLSPRSQAVCVCGYGRLERRDGGWTVEEMTLPNYEGNDWSGMVKNLVFLPIGNSLFCIWRVSPKQVVLELDGRKVKRTLETPVPDCSFGFLRGGSQPIPHKGRWVRFVHGRQDNPKSDQPWTYHLAALSMDPEPPFAVRAVSESPILSGTEQWFHVEPFWKPRILIPYGAIPNGDNFRASVGVNDCRCATCDLTPSDLCLP